MIVKMKKLTLLVSKDQREELIVKLRRLGIVHIKNVSTPSAGEIRALEETITRAKEAISILQPYYAPGEARREKISWKMKEAADNVKEVTSLAMERDDLIEDLSYLENHMEWFKPWGGCVRGIAWMQSIHPTGDREMWSPSANGGAL